MNHLLRAPLLPLIALACAAACGRDAPLPARERALLDVKDYVTSQLVGLRSAAKSLQRAAPTGTGWNRTSHPRQVDAMRGHWADARAAYEHVEGAIAVLFTNYDVAVDARYEDFLENGPHDCPYGVGDCNLFNGEGVTGMHAIERILWSDSISAQTLALESPLPGYQPARFPSSAAEAKAFKNELVGRLIRDVGNMLEEFEPLALGLADAYRGVVSSMEEQREKVTFADSGHDESRYAAHTLADMRANLEGGRRIYEAFRPWLRERDSGPDADAAICAGFARLAQQYAQLDGNNVPAVPPGWSNIDVKQEHLITPYGQLWWHVTQESDPNVPQSLVALMKQGAALLEFADNGK